ncbi:MAG: fumarylacetoacetate hydrolase family protein [Hyphomonadaceae bacterium]|nr:fumarylacetoacetate hydrolase family protein [Hyphomonadaceae bacterium]
MSSLKNERVAQAKIQEAAQRLRAAYAANTSVEPVRDLIGVDDPTTGYIVQKLNTDYWRARGRIPIGNKIGATSEGVQRQFGIDQPDFGVLFSDMRINEGEVVPFTRLIQPRVEAELALVLGQSIDRTDLDDEALRGCIERCYCAVEIVDSRIRDWDIAITDTIADNASSGLFVLGTNARAVADIDFVHCAMSIHKNDEIVSEGKGAMCLGSPIHALRWLADKMHGLGAPLQAGAIVLSGALGPTVSADPGDEFVAAISGFDPLSIVFSGI